MKMQDKIKEIWQLITSKNGKIILFFGFYFIFFTVLIIMSRGANIGSNSYTNSLYTNKENNTLYSFEKLNNEEYQYEYTIQENYEIKTYNNDNIYEMTGYKYSHLLKLEEIKRIIKKSKFLNKTLYSDNYYHLNFEIKTYELLELFNANNVDNASLNTLMVKTDLNGNVKEIEYDFSNYISVIDEDIKIYKVVIKYEY